MKECSQKLGRPPGTVLLVFIRMQPPAVADSTLLLCTKLPLMSVVRDGQHWRRTFV